MTKETLIQKTAEYVLTLPDRTNTAMRDAVYAACPNEDLSGIDFLDFSFLDEIISLVEKTGMVLDYSSREGKCEGVPFNLDFIVRKKRLQKAQITSDLMGYGPCPEPDEAIEQRLTISSNGQIWFTEYLFGNYGNGERQPIGRKLHFSIGKEKAAEILSLLADYMEHEPLDIFATDIGKWDLTLTYPDGHKAKLSCSMCGGITVGDIDLTDFIRAAIPIEDLAVFGGGSDENETF